MRLARVLAFALLFAGALATTATTARAADRVVAYVPNWVDLATFAPGIDYAKLTHVNIAFANPTNDEGDLSWSAKNEVLIERCRAAGVKVLISIGGGSASENKAMQARYFALIAPAKRAAFVAKLVAYVEAHRFDGLDVDLEGPSINADYGAFVHELSLAFRAKGLLLTAALSKGYGGSKVPESAFTDFDFINIMAYDGTGPWSPNRPGQHSSMEFARENVDYWLKRGLAKDRAVLGVPFYGHGFGRDAKGPHGYATLLTRFPGAEKVDQVGETIWYNGIPTIRAKARYAQEQKLGGLMIWSLDNDVKDDRSLLAALHDELHPKKPAEKK